MGKIKSMSVNETKDRVQREGLNRWFNNNCRGTLELATGVGKSRCGVLAAAWVVKQNPLARILIITPTQTIRDEAWVGEFKQWGHELLLNVNVSIQCIQTVHKWTGQNFDLIIADEIHNYVTEVGNSDHKYSKFFSNNKYQKILGLSASISAKLKPMIWKFAPIVLTIDTEKALELELISPFEVYNLEIKLTTEEQLQYDNANEVFNKLFQVFTDFRGIRSLQVLFKCLVPTYFKSFCAKQGYTPEEYYGMKSWPYECQEAMAKRKEIIYNATNKIEVIKKLLQKYPDRRTIIFAQSTHFVNNVVSSVGHGIAHAYHSKIPLKQRKIALNDFNDLTTKSRVIAAASALNEGANLKNISLAIISAGTSTERDFIQRLGRAVRLEKGKEAIMVRLYVAGTQDENWLESSQAKFKGTFIKYVDQVGNPTYNQLEKPQISYDLGNLSED